MKLIHKKKSKVDIDEKSFEKVFKNYYEELCYFATGYLNDMDIAEEIVQEVFYVVWKKRKTIQIETSLKSYLYTATKNMSLKKIRSQKTAGKYIEQALYLNDDKTESPLDELSNRELKQLINRTMEKMPERVKEIFTMSRFEGLKYREIAEKLSISVKTVESNMGKALQMFRDNLHEYIKPV